MTRSSLAWDGSDQPEDASVAVVDANSDGSLSSALFEAGFAKVVDLRDLNLARSYLDRNPCQLVLLDVSTHDERHFRLLKEISDRPECAAIIIGSEQRHAAAHAHLAKPVQVDRLVEVVRKVLQDHLCARIGERSPFARMITRNRAMLDLFSYATAVARSSESILITGETGTGKELMAAAIHACSRRKGEFVALNIAGLDDAMMSDTLFGHRKGSFTGADAPRAGLILRASAGTLFLDEIGDLSVASQVKLLRLLQEGEFFAIGSDLPSRSTARVLVATSQDLRELQANDRFRRDLFYRLRTHHLDLPPLRERKDDLPLLCEHFLREATRSLGWPCVLPTSELLALLENYHFPGNIRELRALLFDAVSCSGREQLSIDRIRSAIASQTTSKAPTDAQIANNSSLRRGIVFPTVLPSLAETEDELVDEAMRRSNGSQSKAARLLGISRQAINKRLRLTAKKLGTTPPSEEGSGGFDCIA